MPMRKLSSLAVLAALVFVVPASVHAQDKIELFAGYSFGHVPVNLSGTILCPGPVCPSSAFAPRGNLSGLEISGVYKTNHGLGLEADFSGVSGSAQGVTAHLQTYLFGPQVSAPGRVSPFAHLLFGVAHESTGSGLIGLYTISPAANTSFAAALGSGLDFDLTRFISIRAIQFDYLLTRFHGNTQAQPRVSVGLVLHF
jgi:hypothetical protein